MGGNNIKTLIFSSSLRHERVSQHAQSLTHANEPGQTNANAADDQSVIDVSSDSSDSSNNFSDSSSVSGDENEYYGGYGRCFRCGECQRLHQKSEIIFKFLILCCYSFRRIS